MRRRRGRTVGRNVPRGNRRACLCKSGRYSRKCCKGYLINQGIGSVYKSAIVETIDDSYKGYVIQHCGDTHKHHVHTHGESLEIGGVYFFELENGHNECYEVIREVGSEGIHINSVSAIYTSCAECNADNP